MKPNVKTVEYVFISRDIAYPAYCNWKRCMGIDDDMSRELEFWVFLGWPDNDSRPYYDSRVDEDSWKVTPEMLHRAQMLVQPALQGNLQSHKGKAMSETILIDTDTYFRASDHWQTLINYGDGVRRGDIEFRFFLGFKTEGQLQDLWVAEAKGWMFPVNSKAVRLIQLLSSPHYHALWKAYQIREAANAVR